MDSKLFVAYALSLFALSVSAEDRLFPTSILNKGEVDIELSVTHSTIDTKISSNGNTGTYSYRATRESAAIRYGIGGYWHVGASLPYLSDYSAKFDYNNPPAHYENNRLEGSQNPNLWVKYGFINDKAKPLSLSGEILVSPNTTGKTSSAYVGVVSAGWKSDESLKFYAIYSGVVRNDSNSADSNGIAIGAYKSINSSVTLIPHASYTRYQSTDSFSSDSNHSLGLSAHIQVANNTYLNPDITFFRNSSAHTNAGTLYYDSSDTGKSIGISIYHLF